MSPPKEDASLAARPLASRGVGKIKILFGGYVAQVRERSVGHVQVFAARTTSVSKTCEQIDQ